MPGGTYQGFFPLLLPVNISFGYAFFFDGRVPTLALAVIHLSWGDLSLLTLSHIEHFFKYLSWERN